MRPRPVMVVEDGAVGVPGAGCRVPVWQAWQVRWGAARKVTHSAEEAVLLGSRVLVMAAAPGRVIDEVTVPTAA
ncbi:hypothetical protein [Streptomyces sp. NPDC056105]|uniref:hypothetical protein n=1 Tax=Streptomyces sp. NPDC056105 TaxID=3345714 RepID=UPI0035DBAF8F